MAERKYEKKNEKVNVKTKEIEEKTKKKNEKTGFLRAKLPLTEKSHSGKDGNYKFLNVPMAFNLDMIKKEIRAGAELFRDLLRLKEIDASRFILIEADNLEEGYLGCTLAYAIQREQDIKKYGESVGYTYESDDFGEEWFDVDEDLKFDLTYLNNHLEYIPVVSMEEITRWVAYVRSGDDHTPFGNSMSAGKEAPKKEPFWLDLGDKPLVITISDICSFGFYSDVLADFIRYFEQSRHVYILIIRDDTAEKVPFGFIYDENDPFSTEHIGEDNARPPEINRLILELTGDYFSIRMNSEERKNYRKLLMRSWLKDYHFSEPEDMDWLIDCVVRLKRDNVSEYMEKMLKLVRKNYPEVSEITPEMLRQQGLLDLPSAKVEKVSLDNLVGMEEIKDQIQSVVKVLTLNKRLRELGKKGAQYHNVLLFQGSPGTAKTTTAKALGRLLVESDLLRNDRFTAVSGSQLKAPYLGQTSGLVHDLFVKNDIILIDEAYSLAPKMNGEIDLYASEALAQLAVELEEHSTDKVVIFAGYGGNGVSEKDNKMKEFLDANPGIRSRINFTITFPNYTPRNMLEIVHFIAKEQEFKMVHSADPEIIRFFETRCKDRTFGNGREARSFVENAVRFAAERYAEGELPKDGNIVLSKKDILDTIRFMKESQEQPGSAGEKYGLIRK